MRVSYEECLARPLTCFGKTLEFIGVEKGHVTELLTKTSYLRDTRSLAEKVSNVDHVFEALKAANLENWGPKQEPDPLKTIHKPKALHLDHVTVAEHVTVVEHVTVAEHVPRRATSLNSPPKPIDPEPLHVAVFSDRLAAAATTVASVCAQDDAVVHVLLGSLEDFLALKTATEAVCNTPHRGSPRALPQNLGVVLAWAEIKGHWG